MKKFNETSFVNKVKNICVVTKNVLLQKCIKYIVLTAIKEEGFDPNDSFRFLGKVLERRVPRWREVADDKGYDTICKHYMHYGELGAKLTDAVGDIELSKKNSGKLKGLFFRTATEYGLDTEALLIELSIDLTGWGYVVSDICKMANGVLSIPTTTTSTTIPVTTTIPTGTTSVESKPAKPKKSVKERNSDKRKAIIGKSVDGTWTKEFSSITAAAKELNASRVGITKNINKYGGYSSVKCTIGGEIRKCVFREKVSGEAA